MNKGIIMVVGHEYQAYPVLEVVKKYNPDDEITIVSSGTARFYRAIYDETDSSDRVYAILFTGGTDVDPAMYGEMPHPETGGPDCERDAIESMLFRWATDREIPIFAYCRGHQFVAVQFGAKLIQHIEGHGIHGTHRATHYKGAKDMDGTEVLINSTHHQAVDAETLPWSANVVVEAFDGTVEAVDYSSMYPALTVQWHPEYDNARYAGNTYDLFIELASNMYVRTIHFNDDEG